MGSARIFLYMWMTSSCSSQVQELIHTIHHVFALKQRGKLDHFLGIKAYHLSSVAILIKQTKYIHDLLCKSDKEDSKVIGSPMVNSCRLSKFDIDSWLTLYYIGV